MICNGCLSPGRATVSSLDTLDSGCLNIWHVALILATSKCSHAALSRTPMNLKQSVSQSLAFNESRVIYLVPRSRFSSGPFSGSSSSVSFGVGTASDSLSESGRRNLSQKFTRSRRGSGEAEGGGSEGEGEGSGRVEALVPVYRSVARPKRATVGNARYLLSCPLFAAGVSKCLSQCLADWHASALAQTFALAHS